MATREQIVAEFKKYDPDRVISEQDIKNVEENGLDLVAKSFDAISAEPDTEVDNSVTVQQQAAPERRLESLSDVAAAEEEIYGQIESITTGAGRFEDAMQEALTLAQQEQAPYEEAIAETRQKERGLSMRKYKELSPEQALRQLASDANRLQTQREFYQKQLTDYEDSVADVVTGIQQAMNEQLSALGLQMQFVDQRRRGILAEEELALQREKLGLSGSGRSGGGSRRSSGTGAQTTGAFSAEDYARMLVNGEIGLGDIPPEMLSAVDAAIPGITGEMQTPTTSQQDGQFVEDLWRRVGVEPTQPVTGREFVEGVGETIGDIGTGVKESFQDLSQQIRRAPVEIPKQAIESTVSLVEGLFD